MKTKCVLLLLMSLCFGYEAKVTKIIDGDTIAVLYQNKEQRVRIYGIDAPERGQPYSNKAKKYLISKIANKSVEVVYKDNDRYGRIIAKILLNNEDIGKDLVKNGYAWAYRHFSKDYISEEEFAKSNKIGLWQDDNPVNPYLYRKSKRKK